MRVTVRARLEEGDRVRLETNLGQLDPCLHPAAFAALAQHLGYEPEPLEMAIGGGGDDHEPPDPRYPWLNTLIDRARRDWDTWGDKLTKEVSKLLKDGALLPMNARNEQALLNLFRDHQVEMVVRFAGHTPDRARLADLIKRGLVAPSIENQSYVDMAWRIGRGLEALHPHAIPEGDDDDLLKEKLRTALAYKMTPQDERALEYAKRQGAMLMRRPAEVFSSELERVVQYHDERRLLKPDELGVIRSAVARSVEGKGSGSLERDLRAAVQGHPTLVNDMRRVARTELTNVHSHGAYIGLKAALAAQGIADPDVFKFVSVHSCIDCRRIWGDPTKPRHYKLSYVEAREAAGGNFGLPRSEWGPCIAGIHPNCTEGPLMYYAPHLVTAIDQAAARFMKRYGGK